MYDQMDSQAGGRRDSTASQSHDLRFLYVSFSCLLLVSFTARSSTLLSDDFIIPDCRQKLEAWKRSCVSASTRMQATPLPAAAMWGPHSKPMAPPRALPSIDRKWRTRLRLDVVDNIRCLQVPRILTHNKVASQPLTKH